MTIKKATALTVASSYGNVINIEAILKNRRTKVKTCCRAPAHFSCECAKFLAIYQRQTARKKDGGLRR